MEGINSTDTFVFICVCGNLYLFGATGANSQAEVARQQYNSSNSLLLIVLWLHI